MGSQLWVFCCGELGAGLGVIVAPLSLPAAGLRPPTGPGSFFPAAARGCLCGRTQSRLGGGWAPGAAAGLRELMALSRWPRQTMIAAAWGVCATPGPEVVCASPGGKKKTCFCGEFAKLRR